MADKQQWQVARGDVLSRRYEIEKELGSGMLGATYLAQHMSSGKHLVVKVLNPKVVGESLERARLDEVFGATKAVRHAGLLRLGEVGEHDGNLFFTEEYFPSQNLRELIDEYQAEQRSFSLQEACQIVIKILEALEALHGGGIYHRNLKPENVLVHTRKTGPGGRNLVRTVKISDSGISALVNPTVFAESYVSREDARYLAPELTSFGQSGSPQSDVYSVGVILYELLVGQTPRGTYLSPTQLRGDLPEHIDDVVEIGLGHDAEDRYPAAADMARDIQRSFSGDLYSDRRPTSVKNVIIGVSVGIIILSALGFYFQTREAPDRVASAAELDAKLRAEVQANTRMPTESELNAMVQAHPEMLYIPPGPFVMGRLHQERLTVASQSEPLAKVDEVGGFFVDRFEFPNRLKGADGEPVHPVAKVTWSSAEEACSAVGKRLCTESEWEKSCKGPGNAIYSYGDTYDEDMCGKGIGSGYTLGDKDTCISGYGVWGMSGGLREWTETTAGSKGTRRVVKGGLRANPERGSRCAFAVDESADYADSTLSFRCCLDLGAAGSAPPAEPAPGAAPAAPADAGAPAPG